MVTTHNNKTVETGYAVKRPTQFKTFKYLAVTITKYYIYLLYYNMRTVK